MKLTNPIIVSQAVADSKRHQLYDIHEAVKHNTTVVESLAAALTNYLYQAQPNEFLATSSDPNGIANFDSDLIRVTKSDLQYSVDTTYDKVFSYALCYDSSGVLQPDKITVTFGETEGVEDRKIIIVTFNSTINEDFRIVLG